MALKISTALRNYVLDEGSVHSAINGGKLHIYSGSPPAIAHGAPEGDLLVTISDDGGSGGLNFESSAVNGALQKVPGQTWSGEVVETGDPGYFILDAGAGTPGEDITAKRIIGSVGGVTANPQPDLILSNVTLTAQETQEINAFFISLFPDDGS